MCRVHSGHLPAEIAATVLTPAEQSELNAFSHPGRRQEWLASRTALKWLLLRRGIVRRWTSAEVLKNDSGRPFMRLSGNDTIIPMDCSLSHKGEYAIAALALLANMRIGVDMERVSSRPSRIRSAFENPGDRIAGREDPDMYFTVLWALKESAAKALGAGIGMLPGLICCGGENGPCEVLNSADGRVVHAVHGASGGYVISLAWAIPC